MGTTFMTNDYWAQRKGFSKFLTDTGSGYVDKNSYPNATTLDLFRAAAYGIIMTCADGTPDLDSGYLSDLEYRMVELMMDEEQSRETEQARNVHIPRDYMYDRDRQKVANSGSNGFTRGILNV